jgi:hypothetical protein
MAAPRNDLTKGLCSKPLLLAAALALLSGSASAQEHSRAPGRDPLGPTPLEQQQQKQIDNDHKAATKTFQIKSRRTLGATFGRRRPPRVNLRPHSELATRRFPPPRSIERHGGLTASLGASL